MGVGRIEQKKHYFGRREGFTKNMLIFESKANIIYNNNIIMSIKRYLKNFYNYNNILFYSFNYFNDYSLNKKFFSKV